MQIEEIVKGMNEGELHEIIQNYRTLQQEGVLGDCYLREQVNNYKNNMSTFAQGVPTLMKEFYISALERFYEKHVWENFVTKNNAALLDKIIVRLKSESGTVKMYEDDFCVDDYAGGNIDDAWQYGANDGSRFLANELLEMIEECSKENTNEI